MGETKKTLTKKDRLAVCWRHQFLQGSWNYERMQNGGYVYSLIPAIKKLYTNDKDRCDALKRHLEFYNTQPFVSAPIVGVSLGLEEEKANGKDISDKRINDAKVAMMGPLAGIGDPLFWFTLRPILAALGASMALSGNIVGPLLFFICFNVIRFGFMWITQEKGYELKESIVDQLSPQLLQMISKGATIAAMFIFGALVNRFVSIDLSQTLPLVQLNLDALLPSLLSLGLTLFMCYRLKHKASPLVLILELIVICVICSCLGWI